MIITRREYSSLWAKHLCDKDLDRYQPQQVAIAHARSYIRGDAVYNCGAWPTWLLLREVHRGILMRSKGFSTFPGDLLEIGEELVGGEIYDGKPYESTPADFCIAGPASVLGKVAAELYRRLMLEERRDTEAAKRRWLNTEELP